MSNNKKSSSLEIKLESGSKPVIFIATTKDDVEIYSHALDMYCAMNDVLNYIRSQLKYNEELTESESERLEQIRSMIADAYPEVS